MGTLILATLFCFCAATVAEDLEFPWHSWLLSPTDGALSSWRLPPLRVHCPNTQLGGAVINGRDYFERRAVWEASLAGCDTSRLRIFDSGNRNSSQDWLPTREWLLKNIPLWRLFWNHHHLSSMSFEEVFSLYAKTHKAEIGEAKLAIIHARAAEFVFNNISVSLEEDEGADRISADEPLSKPEDFRLVFEDDVSFRMSSLHFTPLNALIPTAFKAGREGTRTLRTLFLRPVIDYPDVIKLWAQVSDLPRLALPSLVLQEFGTKLRGAWGTPGLAWHRLAANALLQRVKSKEEPGRYHCLESRAPCIADWMLRRTEAVPVAYINHRYRDIPTPIRQTKPGRFTDHIQLHMQGSAFNSRQAFMHYELLEFLTASALSQLPQKTRFAEDVVELLGLFGNPERSHRIRDFVKRIVLQTWTDPSGSAWPKSAWAAMAISMVQEPDLRRTFEHTHWDLAGWVPP